MSGILSTWRCALRLGVVAAACGASAAPPAAADPLQLSRQLVFARPPALPPLADAMAWPTLRKGAKGPAVGELTALLEALAIDSFDDEERLTYGARHESAVRALQTRLNLVPDGIAGPRLYANLAVPPKHRAAALEAWAMRLEHLAYQARSEGRDRMVVVNVPSMTLRAIDLVSGRTVVESPIVVGRPDRKTPLGRINIVALTFNPSWKPPPVVVRQDILPRLGRDPAWFDGHALVALGPDGVEKPASQLTAAEYGAGWKIYQESGERSALGRLKFETDSRESIYLHDTNERSLFSKAVRAKSSGCIRVEQWLDLAAFLSGQDATDIRARLDGGATSSLKLGAVPVFIEYSLGDVAGGIAQVHPDIYRMHALER